MQGNKKIGALGEAAARRFLLQKNYRIIAKNHRTKLGEIDIIAKKENTLVFVEVKTRQSSVFGSPGEAVDYRKQEKLYRLAEQYIAVHKIENMDIRFDIMEVWVQETKVTLNHIQNAFYNDYGRKPLPLW